MSLANQESLLPGLEAQRIKGIRRKSTLLACLISALLFGLLPLSEFAREEQWVVRDAEAEAIPPPSPPPPTEVERSAQHQKQDALKTPRLDTAMVTLDTSSMDISLDVTPGDFKAAFSLASYNPTPNGFGQDLVFSLHELDRNPSVLNRGKLIYPPHLKRRGLEGEVKLLVQIDEQGKVKVLEVVSSTHPDFAESSKIAAESSVYEAPKRNGEPVRTQFYLPIRFTLLDN
jgi:periplasmic protein TonB